VYSAALRLHHLGFVTKSIRESSSFFLKLGYELQFDLFYDDYRGIEIQFMKYPGSNLLIELISPKIEKVKDVKNTEAVELTDSLNKMIKSRPGLYHMGYELISDDFHPQDLGLRKISVKAPAIALNNREVEFYLHIDGSIVEVIFPE
jgi:methylmalonyl-CoA/ethylmalonyl-CoA epimerase